MKITRMLGAALAVTTLTLGAAQAQIKISHQWKANVDGRDRAARVFVKEVQKKDKSLKFRIYPALSLGMKPRAQLDALQNGTLEMAVFPMSYAVGKAPEFSIVIMPGTISSLDHAMRMKGSPFYNKLQEIAEANGIRIISWWWTPGGFATKDREIGGPGTIDGVKIRAADPTFEEMLKAAGASVVSMPSTEIYPSLQSGVIDGALTSAETFVSMRLYEQTRHATVGGDYTLWMLLQPLVMSKQHWDALTPEQKKIFEDAAAKSDEFFLGLQREATDKMATVFTKAGAQVRQLKQDEYDGWVALAKKTSWPAYAAKSPASKELLDLIQQVK
ncbi:MAG: TRAP transporter substrate-binding protein DctP [Burkholderiales bacterium]|nr:MAG: TRAP transporter substrate-binding protein DctP [Burkholderiales bacterium]